MARPGYIVARDKRNGLLDYIKRSKKELVIINNDIDNFRLSEDEIANNFIPKQLQQLQLNKKMYEEQLALAERDLPAAEAEFAEFQVKRERRPRQKNFNVVFQLCLSLTDEMALDVKDLIAKEGISLPEFTRRAYASYLNKNVENNGDAS